MAGKGQTGEISGNTAWLGFLILASPVLLLVGGCTAYNYSVIDVSKGHVAVLTRKTGLDLRNGEEMAPTPDHKGVQREMLGSGRHFRNPYVWDWEIIEETIIPENEFGVRIRYVGDTLDYGEFIAWKPEQKGIVAEVLKPGRYAVNPWIESVEMHPPMLVPAGYLGVVTNLAGPIPEDPNVLLVPKGFRGVQKDTLPEGRYLRNPYIEQIHLIDCRSQRFNLAERKDMGFPSKDGFWVRLDGIVEFRITPQKAAEVFVAYNEDENGDELDEEIVRKVILPNARSFCRLEGSNSVGRDFIQGVTRVEFQEKFETAMRNACEPLGVEIIQALITNIYPPEPIAKPVRERELAKQLEKQYQQQILQQESEINLAIERELVKQKTALVQSEQDVVRLTTEAVREQEVAVTKANEALEVAKLKLEAAVDEAQAVLSRGRAEASVVDFANDAQAAGWRKSVEAFNGDGRQYAQYVLFQKLSGAYRNVMVNTADSPIMRIFESFSGPRPSPSHGVASAPAVAGSSSAVVLPAAEVSTIPAHRQAEPLSPPSKLRPVERLQDAPPTPPKVEPVKVEPVKVEPVKVEVSEPKPEPVKAEPAKTEPVKTESAKNDEPSN